MFVTVVEPGDAGGGWTIPAGLINPQVRSVIKDLRGTLEYLLVDDDCGTVGRDDAAVQATAGPGAAAYLVSQGDDRG